MSAPKWHIERLREQLRREIAAVIAQEIRDPRIPDIVTITEVKLGKDTRNATVYASIMGDDEEGISKQDAVDALNRAAPFIQRLVASRVVVKNFPRLIFKLDDSIEHGMHINELFKTIRDDLDSQDDNNVTDNKQDGAD